MSVIIKDKRENAQTTAHRLNAGDCFSYEGRFYRVYRHDGKNEIVTCYSFSENTIASIAYDVVVNPVDIEIAITESQES